MAASHDRSRTEKYLTSREEFDPRSNLVERVYFRLAALLSLNQNAICASAHV